MLVAIALFWIDIQGRKQLKSHAEVWLKVKNTFKTPNELQREQAYPSILLNLQ
jgi:hypothetical protein